MQLNIVLFVFTAGIGVAVGKESLPSVVPIYPNLMLVARVDGKIFFADNTTRNWQHSKDYCQSMGMQLASITSKAQYDALSGALSNSTFIGGHWTSGRDAQAHRQFSWDLMNERISTTFLPFKNQNSLPFKTCLLFYPDSPAGVIYWSCESPGFKVLCEA